MSENLKISPYGFREYDARWLYEKDINFVFLNVDNQKWNNYIRKFDVNGIPQVNLFNRGGTLKFTLIGKQEELTIRDSIDQLVGEEKSHVEIINSESSVIKKNQNISTNEKIKRITFPCIVKPNNGGSSIGLSKVYKEVDLNDKIQIAFKEDKEVLIENFLDGQEVSVGVIQNKNERII